MGEEVLLVVVVAGKEGESADRRLRGRKEGRGGVGAQGRQFGEERAGAQGGEVVVRVKRVGERLVAKIGRIVRIDGRGLIERVERWLHEGIGRPIPLLEKNGIPDGAARRRGRHAEPGVREGVSKVKTFADAAPAGSWGVYPSRAVEVSS